MLPSTVMTILVALKCYALSIRDPFQNDAIALVTCAIPMFWQSSTNPANRMNMNDVYHGINS